MVKTCTISSGSPVLGPLRVAVRLEGGLGDHILGMRVLRFVRDRHPSHDIEVYSECGSDSTPWRVVEMSPYVSTIKVIRRLEPVNSLTEAGSLEGIHEDDKHQMRSAELFIDSYSGLMFSNAAAALNVPMFSILDRRPELRVSGLAQCQANQFLGHARDSAIAAINLTKYGGLVLQRHEATIKRTLLRLLENPRVIVLNIFSSAYDYPHWPEPRRTMRRLASMGDSAFMCRLCGISDRVIPCVDLPIATIAALLTRCRYFVGVDNGIKHLAWALDIPHTFFHTTQPSMQHILRWMPDVHRMLLFDCRPTDLSRHLDEAAGALSGVDA